MRGKVESGTILTLFRELSDLSDKKADPPLTTNSRGVAGLTRRTARVYEIVSGAPGSIAISIVTTPSCVRRGRFGGPLFEVSRAPAAATRSMLVEIMPLLASSSENSNESPADPNQIQAAWAYEIPSAGDGDSRASP